MTVHSLPDAALQAPAQRTWVGRLQMSLILLVCAAPVLVSYLLYFGWRPTERDVAAYATLIQPSVGLPAANAHDLDGQLRSLRALKGQWLLIVLAPGSCDAACEERLFLQRQLREMTGRERGRIDKVWLVTDDAPLRPELRQALGGPAPVTVLRLPRDAVQRWLRPADGQALEDHLYLVDPMGEWMMRAPPQPDPGKLKRDIERLLRASASWDLPGR